MWFRYLKLMLSFFMLFSILMGSINWIDKIEKNHQKGADLSSAEELNLQISSELYIPPPLPFLAPENIIGRRETFILPKDEVALQKFRITITLPSKYQPIAMHINEQCFSADYSADGMVCVALACQGKCQEMKTEIANAMLRDLEKFFIQNRVVRVLHQYVHHSRSLEYSFWYTDDAGAQWFYGKTLKSRPEWLDVVSCEYFSKVELLAENDEALHLAWDEWHPMFLSYCRQLEILVE